MEKRITVADIKNQMRILKEMLEDREAFLVEALEINKIDRHNIKPSDENAAEDYDLLVDEAMEIRNKIADVRIALANVSNDLLRIF
jgi:hypothetical protein